MKRNIGLPITLNCIGTIILIFALKPPIIGFAIGMIVFAIMGAIWAD